MACHTLIDDNKEWLPVASRENVTEIQTLSSVDGTCLDTVSVDGAVSGEWSSSCGSTDQVGNYARYYSFTLSEGSNETISLESSTDPYLYLRSGEAKSGAYLYENDDVAPGTDTNSGIEETLGAGIYTRGHDLQRRRDGELHPERRRLVAVREYETDQ